MKYDLIVIGGGIVGTAVLDRLTKFGFKALMLEKEDDVASFSTRANSGIVHAGYDCEPGTLKAKFNVLGNPLIWHDAEELNVPHEKCGSIVVAQSDGLEKLEELRARAEKNGVEVRILDRAETLKIEPNISDNIMYSLYAPSAGTVSPYQLAIAYADRSILNGAEIRLECEVKKIEKLNTGFKVFTANGNFEADILINCAGAAGADINDMIGAEHYVTQYKRGEYMVLDNTEINNVSTVIFPLPTDKGKGILVSRTADGNVIYGPTAVETSCGDTACTLDGLDELKRNVPLTYKRPAFNKCIRIYAGLRSQIGHDFIICESSKIENFYMAIGICSPGLTSAPAIAEHIAALICQKRPSRVKEGYISKLPERKHLKELDEDTVAKLAADDERWGRIVCRCEKVTEAEIVEAIHSPLPAKTVDAVKRRTRAGMGRCQGGFCGPRVMEIISRELNIPLEEVKKGLGANIARFKIKEVE